MTVCIAALYENGEGAVLISDQMVTAHIPIGYEFEQKETSKIIAMDDSESVYALVSGDVLLGNQIIGAAKTQLQQQNGNSSAEHTAQVVRAAYQQARLTEIINRELEPRGLDLNGFYGRHQQLAQQVVQMIDQAMTQTNIGVEFIIAGFSGSTHTIHTILNPGVISNNNPIGHGAIGSGSPHALYSLIEDNYNPSLSKEDVIDMVERAKTRSEVAPGVGSATAQVVMPREQVEGNDND